jgi:hypothetical protein
VGYCYSRGRLCCDACGITGARKRTCPHRVHYPEGGSLPYCQAPALCGTCYDQRRGVLHEECAAGAAAQNDWHRERGRRLDAGEFEVRTAWGDWHSRVPAGFVGVRFVGKGGSEVYRLVPAADYNVAERHWLSDYAATQAWADPDHTLPPSKAVSLA